MKRNNWNKVTRLPSLFILVIVVLDQWSKLRILNSEFLCRGGRIEIIPNFFHVVFVTNTGAAWGILTSQTTLLALISAIVFCVLVAYFEKFTCGFLERCVAISLLMGGIAGNFIDRIWRRTVIDFLSFTYKSFEWPAFNIADSAICVGVGVFVISSWLRPEQDSTN